MQSHSNPVFFYGYDWNLFMYLFACSGQTLTFLFCQAQMKNLMKSLRSLFHEEHDCNSDSFICIVIYYANEYACTVSFRLQKRNFKRIMFLLDTTHVSNHEFKYFMIRYSYHFTESIFNYLLMDYVKISLTYIICMEVFCILNAYTYISGMPLEII